MLKSAGGGPKIGEQVEHLPAKLFLPSVITKSNFWFYASQTPVCDALAPNLTDAFQLQAPGQFGDSGRNSLRGPHTNVFDFALMKLGQLNSPSLWSRAVTDISDLFANLGRATARFPFAENGEQARAGFVDPAGEEADWKPVVEQLFHELDTLGGKDYSEWAAEPCRELEQV